MYIPKFFGLAELINSATAKANGIANVPNWSNINNMLYLCEHILDPIRVIYGKPIRVSSCYRCNLLNKKVGGVSNSQHLQGLAADITATNMAALERAIDENGIYDQFIKETSANGSSWYHISIAGEGKPNRHQKFNLKK